LYATLLQRWSKVYNISGHRQLDQIVRLHIIDSLSIVQPLQEFLENRSPCNILDVGSGAGLPGIVLAICFPEHHFVCIDAVAKKAAFLQQVKLQLPLLNLRVIHDRIENHQANYHIITSRAFSSLQSFVFLTRHCLDIDGSWFAMKGKYPVNEIDKLDSDVEVFHVKQLDIPDQDGERCLVWIRRRTQPDIPLTMQS
jgi:16S rRNA (guanine527-N7)-methyltransferase